MKSDKPGDFLIEQTAKLLDHYLDKAVRGDRKAEKKVEQLLQQVAKKIEKLLDSE